MAEKQYYFTLREIWKRTKQEYHYYMDTPWTLNDVGNFWDTVTDYDDVNETLYTYFLRFTNSYDLVKDHLPRNDYRMLDIQARSGKGSLFWHDKGKIKSSTLVDFSDHLLNLADNRLKNTSINYKTIKISDFPLPFDNESFDFVCTYETVEHVFNYEVYINELSRVLEKKGILILTCPNVMWEWVHWLAAIININHSEGPHRFRTRHELFRSINHNDLEVLEENNTIFLPFNNPISIKIDKLLSKCLPKWIKSIFGLRRTLVLRKP